MYQIFSLAIPHDPEELEALNAFIASHRIVHATHEMVIRDGTPYCVFLLEYTSTGSALKASPARNSISGNTQHVDYSNVLTTEEFQRFDKMRDVRKEIGTTEGVKLFTVMTNAELAALAKANPHNQEEMLAVEGVSHERLERYGTRFLACLQAVQTADNPQTNDSKEEMP